MKKTTFLIASALSAAVAFTAPYPAAAAQHEKSKADDTQMNKQEKEQTAEQQKETKTDREITRQIRRALMKNKSLSTYAHNVKIITQDGKVTLKGPVRTEKETMIIEKAAVNVAGKGNVTNELEVVVPKKAKKEKEEKETKE